MDPISHAASGAVAFLALKNRPAHRFALPLAALAAASPDVDVFLAPGPLHFLLLHRGITHSLASLPFMGLALACASFPFWRKTTTGHWNFVKVWLFMCAMVGLHIWLDVVTTYGTMIFLPFSHERVRLNGLFIVDPMLTLPLVGCLIYATKKKSRTAILAAFAWIFFWPGLGVSLANIHTFNVKARFAAQGYPAAQVVVLPDAFSPLFWRLLYTEKQENEAAADVSAPVFEQGLDLLGRERSPAQRHMGMPAFFAEDLSRLSIVCKYFLDFTILPVLVAMPERYIPEKPTGRASAASGRSAGEFRLVHDLRFGSSLTFVRKIMDRRFNANMPPFALMLELTGDGSMKSGVRPIRERLLFSDSKRDSGWQAPILPEKRPLWFRLAGLP